MSLQSQFEWKVAEATLLAPLKWKKPRRIFVLGDLFHEDVPDSFIARVLKIICECPQHQFIVLTKRGKRMAELFSRPTMFGGPQKPPTNLVVGGSISTQAEADDLIPWLLKTPAAYRIASLEPLLGAVDLERIDVTREHVELQRKLTGDPNATYEGPALRNVLDGTGHDGEDFYAGATKLDGVRVGGESGPGARPMNPDWPRGVRNQCIAAGVKFFFKQWGEYESLGPMKNADGGQRFGALKGSASGKHLVVDGQAYLRVGKKRAGRLLDGREWNEWVGGEGDGVKSSRAQARKALLDAAMHMRIHEMGLEGAKKNLDRAVEVALAAGLNVNAEFEKDRKRRGKA